MYQKSDIEMERAKVIKVSRTLIRLKKSIEADQELNDILPSTLSEFDAALQSGELVTLNEELLKDLLGS